MKTKRDKHCRGCVHYYGMIKCCNYILDKGRSRPCPPGKDCTVKEKKKNG